MMLPVLLCAVLQVQVVLLHTVLVVCKKFFQVEMTQINGLLFQKVLMVDQNTYCRSLGDCGAYYNFVGEAGYDGFSSTMFDEEFFNEAKDIEALNEDDLGDWDSLK